MDLPPHPALLGLVIAWLVLPLIWFLHRRLGVPKTPAALLYLLLTASPTILVLLSI